MTEQAVSVAPDENGQRTVCCVGNFDLDTLQALRSVCEAAVADGVSRLVIDAGRVTFADSSFLNLLLHTHRGIDVVVAGPPSRVVKRLLEITGADQVLTVTDGTPPR
ncbi:STAS domain-containing protein [Streptomyces sp. NPDC056224]|uniref:STAS domain-containing protein n=1 Tax=Streptomyces sp. NPDC056224 TaxID=3345750 RepID=UPI0035E0C80F